MKSKEALTNIDCLLSDYVCRLKPDNSLYCEYDDGSKYIDIIEKDLGVLEILKEFEVDIATVKNFDDYANYTYIQRRYRRGKAMSYEQWIIIKEWLNDK